MWKTNWNSNSPLAQRDIFYFTDKNGFKDKDEDQSNCKFNTPRYIKVKERVDLKKKLPKSIPEEYQKNYEASKFYQ